MPIEYDFDEVNGVLRVRMMGVVGDEDLIGYAEAITRDESVDPKHDELIDLREHERRPEAVRVAFVASSDAAFGLARMYQAFRAESKARIEVYRELAEAREFLGLDPE